MTDKRSGKIAFIAHCILNQNSRVQGLAHFPAAITPIIEELLRHEIGIVQMPCPELLYIGYRRWAQTKDQYDTPNYRLFCQKIAKQIANQIQEYAKNGVKTIAILGIEGSPTCAITKTKKGYIGGKPEKSQKQKTEKAKEKGILIEEIQKTLKKLKIKTNFIEVDNRNPKKATTEIRKILAQD